MRIRMGTLKIGDKKQFLHEMLEAVVISAAIIAAMLAYRLILNGKDPVAAAREGVENGPLTPPARSSEGLQNYPELCIVKKG